MQHSVCSVAASGRPASESKEDGAVPAAVPEEEEPTHHHDDLRTQRYSVLLKQPEAVPQERLSYINQAAAYATDGPRDEPRDEPRDSTTSAPRSSQGDSASGAARLKTSSTFFVDRSTTHNGALVIDPESRIYKAWSWWTVVLTLVFVFLVPLRLAFAPDDMEGRWAVWRWVEVFIDLNFAVDILFCFRLGFMEYGELVTDPMVIARRYMAFRLWVDLAATMPHGALFGHLTDEAGRTVLELIGIARFIRLERLAALVQRMESNYKYDYVTVALTKFCLLLFLSGHCWGCLFFYLARLNDFDPESSWVGLYAPELLGASLSDRYSTSIYWAFTTLTTVGYGDYSPVGSAERSVTIVIMLFNLCLSAYILGNMTLLATKNDAQVSEYRTNMQRLHKFMKIRRVPRDLYDSALAHLQLTYDMSQDRDDALRHCPEFIRVRITKHLYKNVALEAYLFQGVSEQFIDQLVANVNVEFFFPGSDLLNEGDDPFAFYCILEGVVDVISVENGKEQVCRQLTEGMMFGEEALVCEFAQPWTIRTASWCRMLEFKRVHWRALAERFPRDCRKCQQHVVTWVEENLMGGMVNAEGHNADPKAAEVAGAARSGVAHLEQGQVANLCYAATRKDTAEARRLLLQGDMSPNAADYDGRAAIHLSAVSGDAEMVKLLLEFGADPNLKDNFGTTPLWEAVSRGHHEVAEILREAGAKLHMRDPGGTMCGTAFGADTKLLGSLLRHGADPNAADYDGRTALHLASAEGILPCVQLLLEHGAEPLRPDRWGHTAVTEAESGGHSRIVTLLKESSRVEGSLDVGDVLSGKVVAQLEELGEEGKKDDSAFGGSDAFSRLQA